MIAQWDAKKNRKSRSRLCFLPWLVQAQSEGDKHSQVLRRLHAICLTFFFRCACPKVAMLAQTRRKHFFGVGHGPRLAHSRHTWHDPIYVNTFPLKRKCPGKPVQRTLVAIWIRRATCGTELAPLKLISRFDFPRSILVRRTTLWWLPARLINGTLAFAFCMITHNTTKFENYVYHPVSTLVFTCVYIPWGLIAKKMKDPWLVGKNTFQS